MTISDFRQVTNYDFRPALWLGCLGQVARLGWAGLGWPDEARAGPQRGLAGPGLARRLDWARLGWAGEAGLVELSEAWQGRVK